MSERLEEEEEVSLSHFIHEHPLTLMESDNGNECHGCARDIKKLAAYACKQCQNKNVLHEECGEMPTEIRVPMHRQHTLVQKRGNQSLNCAFCENRIGKIGYFCTNSGCEFQLHLDCTPSAGLQNVGDELIWIKHPSHPQHQLLLLRKRHTFKCDACGIIQKGRSYICVACQYWIHERCAALPSILDYRPHHHHPLLLAFDLPRDYCKFSYSCDVCRHELLLRRWIYHCQACRYIVHIECTFKPPALPHVSSDNASAMGGQDVIQLPIGDVIEDLIKPFVMRERGEISMPRHDHKHRFSQHPHDLSLVSSFMSKADDDDDLDSRKIQELSCDGCTMPMLV